MTDGMVLNDTQVVAPLKITSTGSELMIEREKEREW